MSDFDQQEYLDFVEEEHALIALKWVVVETEPEATRTAEQTRALKLRKAAHELAGCLEFYLKTGAAFLKNLGEKHMREMAGMGVAVPQKYVGDGEEPYAAPAPDSDALPGDEVLDVGQASVPEIAQYAAGILLQDMAVRPYYYVGGEKVAQPIEFAKGVLDNRELLELAVNSAYYLFALPGRPMLPE